MQGKVSRFTFRLDVETLQLLRMLEERTGHAKSVVIRDLIRKAAEGESPPRRLNEATGNQPAAE